MSNQEQNLASENGNLLPRAVRTIIEIAAKNVASLVPVPLWDEATEYFVAVLDNESKKKLNDPELQEFRSMKLLADIKSQIHIRQTQGRYFVSKTNSGVL